MWLFKRPLPNSIQFTQPSLLNTPTGVLHMHARCLLRNTDKYAGLCRLVAGRGFYWPGAEHPHNCRLASASGPSRLSTSASSPSDYSVSASNQAAHHSRPAGYQKNGRVQDRLFPSVVSHTASSVIVLSCTGLCCAFSAICLTGLSDLL